MIVRDSEAKEKTCMMTFEGGNSAAARPCIGSKCMGWRPIATTQPQMKDCGYCGMAGPLDKLLPPPMPMR